MPLVQANTTCFDEQLENVVRRTNLEPGRCINLVVWRQTTTSKQQSVCFQMPRTIAQQRLNLELPFLGMLEGTSTIGARALGRTDEFLQLNC